MRVNKTGIFFSYYGDELLWVWPWRRKDHNKFFSSIFEREFPSLKEYWYFSGGWNEACRKEKVLGYSEFEVLSSWVKKEFRHNTVIILKNINVEMKSTVFWKSVDIFTRKELLKDVPVLLFSNKVDAAYVLGSIPTEFADAYLFYMGELDGTNNENNVKQSIEENRSNNLGTH